MLSNPWHDSSYRARRLTGITWSSENIIMKRTIQKTIMKRTIEELDNAVNTLTALGYVHFGGPGSTIVGSETVFFQTLQKEEDLEIQPVLLDPDKPLPPVRKHIKSIILKIMIDFAVEDVAKLVRLERGSNFRRRDISNEIAKLRYHKEIEVVKRCVGPFGSVYRLRKRNQ